MNCDICIFTVLANPHSRAVLGPMCVVFEVTKSASLWCSLYTGLIVISLSVALTFAANVRRERRCEHRGERRGEHYGERSRRTFVVSFLQRHFLPVNVANVGERSPRKFGRSPRRSLRSPRSIRPGERANTSANERSSRRTWRTLAANVGI